MERLVGGSRGRERWLRVAPLINQPESEFKVGIIPVADVVAGGQGIDAQGVDHTRQGLGLRIAAASGKGGKAAKRLIESEFLKSLFEDRVDLFQPVLVLPFAPGIVMGDDGVK